MKNSLLIAAVTAQLSAFALAAPARAFEISDFLGGAPANGLLPMEDILTRARDAVSGTVTEVELERGKWIYEVEIRTPEGREIELKYDARTGDLLSRRASRK